MAVQNTVKFTIQPGGEINLEVIGGQGESCVVATQELEVSLASAGNKTDEGKKPEFYEGGGGISVFNDIN